ncbi:hypothetical protein ACN47E_007611 [Coniothyrium glycines]
MHLTKVLAASLLAPSVIAHTGIPGLPKLIGVPAQHAADFKARTLKYPAKAPRSELKARQGGQDGRCGPSFGCATCAEGYCCSSGGWCGQGQDYCQAPDSLFEYGPAADANVVPPGGSTLSTARTKVGSVVYGGPGVYVCTKPGQVAITYDDGPYTYTADLLDMFKSYNFQATFFMTGINLYKGRIDDTTKPWAAVIQRMLAEGHQLASHTWSHQDLSTLTKAQRYDQMVRLEMALTNIVGKFPTYMRPPYSSCSAASGCEQDMADLGYHISYFDLDTDDYNNVTPELQQNAKNRVSAALEPANAASDEFLAIAHDIHFQTVYNLTGFMLDLMVTKGFKGVTMGECLGDPEANWYRTPSERPASTAAFTPPSCASTLSSSLAASATSSGVAATPTSVSTDGTCGGASKFTCSGFSQGECCSQYGWCGASEGHCGTGCQAGFGKCGLAGSSSSPPPAVSSSAGTPSIVQPSSSARASSTVASSIRTSSTRPVSSAATPSPSTRPVSSAATPSPSTRAASSAATRSSSTRPVSSAAAPIPSSRPATPSPTPTPTGPAGCSPTLKGGMFNPCFWTGCRSRWCAS